MKIRNLALSAFAVLCLSSWHIYAAPAFTQGNTLGAPQPLRAMES